jgi:peptide/nickel transport system substrate-binding protein
MVQDLGYTKGPDGMFRDAAGQPLSVEVRATGTDLNQKNMHAAADYWRRIGVGAEEVAIPPQLASDLQYRATFPAFNAQRQGGEMAFVQSFHSSQRRLPEVRYAGSNNTGYSTPELDRLIDGYTTTIPFDERMRAAAAAARIITDQVVELPLFYDSQPALISNKLVNIAAARGQSHMAWNADQWDVRQ